MFKIYPKNLRTTNLFDLAKKLNDEKFPSQKNEQQKSTNSTNQNFEKTPKQVSKKQPWWKFW
jgi:hypothetical protein